MFTPAKIHIPSLMLMWQFPGTLVSSLSHSSAHSRACLPSNSWSKAVKGHQYCSVSVPGGSLLWQNATLPEQLCLAPEAEEVFPIWTVKLSFPIWCCHSISSILKFISVFALSSSNLWKILFWIERYKWAWTLWVLWYGKCKLLKQGIWGFLSIKL